MSADVVEKWLLSGLNAIIARISLKPIEHNLMKGKPLSSQKGQAEAFFLMDDKGNWWILKKFHSNANLDYRYLTKIGGLLPKDDGFMCGMKRYVLSRGTLWRTRGYHHAKDLDTWLDGTVLMPRVTGLDWATLADEIRDGNINPDELQRLAICRNLTKLIELLEYVRCCHRDLSCGNVFVDTNTWQVYLIDFDSLYHPSLTMPRATTCGTAGYTSHLAWNNGNLDPHGTWCEHVDRYALALLNAEVLLVRPGAQATGEGGMFDQDELRAKSGTGINSLVSQLRAKYPQAATLLQTAVQSSSFADCPSPHDWNRFYSTIPGLTVQPPKLADLKNTQAGYFARILKRCRPAAPLWPAPSLKQMPSQILQIIKAPEIMPPKVHIPPDPWPNRN